eukprot:TRINITY_DN21789_c0_g1_i1.p1 TRINITY_DN21789_c0_g1~~TRINITY_DN21789_c0_g1_i1.p1  ORF type:complete len:322 (-),score=69.19 TRINITY_DN21789_c0_g1_i1:59-1000(-)
MAAEIALSYFRKLYNEKVVMQIAAAKEEEEKDGKPFWNGLRRKPRIIQFDAEDPIHAQFLAAFQKILMQARENARDEIAFEKDDNDHLDLLLAMAHISCQAFNLQFTLTRWQAQHVAGNIVPSIINTSAIAAGYACLQLYTAALRKLLSKQIASAGTIVAEKMQPKHFSHRFTLYNRYDQEPSLETVRPLQRLAVQVSKTATLRDLQVAVHNLADIRQKIDEKRPVILYLITPEKRLYISRHTAVVKYLSSSSDEECDENEITDPQELLLSSKLTSHLERNSGNFRIVIEIEPKIVNTQTLERYFCAGSINGQ